MGRSLLGSCLVLMMLICCDAAGAGKEPKPEKVPVGTARANARGNELLRKGEYAKAADVYREEALKRPENGILQRNLAGALVRSGQVEEGLPAYRQALRFSNSPQDKAKALYDLGNTLALAGQMQPALDSYAQAMLLDPEDLDIKHNFEFLMQQMQQQQQSQGQQNQQQNEQEQQQQQQQQQQQSEDQQQQSQPREEPKPELEKKPEPMQPFDPEAMNPEDAQRLLDALLEEERELQAQRQRQQLQTRNVEKDW